MSAVIDLVDVRKSFTMHLQGGLRLPVVAGVSFSARAGECVALAGPSGIGKSSILKMIFGNYRCDGGHILLRDTGDDDRYRDRAAARDHRAAPACHGLCQPVPARGAAGRGARRGRRAAGGRPATRARRRAPRRRAAAPPQHSGTAVAAATGDLFRRRAAARQYRARLPARACRSCCSTSRPPRSMPPTAPRWSR